MKTDKRNIKEIIEFEKEQYCQKFALTSRIKYIKAFLFQEPVSGIMKWQFCSRKCDYYSFRNNLSGKVLAQVFRLLRNYYGKKMNIEASTGNIGKGLLIYHSGGLIINSASVIGEDVHFHGANCVGNSGETNGGCPRIGNNVIIGVGAKIIGDIDIADGITIGAGAVVVKSFMEPNITIAGVPAKKIIYK